MNIKKVLFVEPLPKSKRPRQEITINHNPQIDKWFLLVTVYRFKGGTHSEYDYDIVFNSDCNSQYFDTLLDASLHANNILAKHEHDNEMQYKGIYIEK